MAAGDVLVLIPARMASTRLPGKPLADLCGKPMIVHVLERATAAAVGSGLGLSESVFRYAIASARWFSRCSPAKLILVPGAYVRGLVRNLLRSSTVHSPPLDLIASE